MFSLDALPASPTDILNFRLSEGDLTTALVAIGVVIVVILGIIVLKRK